MIMLSFAKFITANEAIASMAGEIRPVVLSDGICDPAIVYALTNKQREKLLNSSVGTLTEASIAIDIYSETYETLRAMANTVRNELEPYIGPFGDHIANKIDFDGDSDGYNSALKLYTASQQISLWYHDP